jgi:hypothetical protein
MGIGPDRLEKAVSARCRSSFFHILRLLQSATAGLRSGIAPLRGDVKPYRAFSSRQTFAAKIGSRRE